MLPHHHRVGDIKLNEHEFCDAVRDAWAEMERKWSEDPYDYADDSFLSHVASLLAMLDEEEEK